ncbi:hypothetical protein P7K49_036991 [Saguinus oedipus]|uniref:Uncharacterized protein n=1 Tax=Saguinus oedipus TaxID=9490 RepID=A0ABQ9TLT1_SAGOE|nr:hypothetical protein P7K49_036991 [Saguinus oedipus]
MAHPGVVPMRAFCGECLQPCLQVPSPLCPLCRLPFDPKKVDKATHVEKQLSSYKAPCRGCNKKVLPARAILGGGGTRWAASAHGFCRGRGWGRLAFLLSNRSLLLHQEAGPGTSLPCVFISPFPL